MHSLEQMLLIVYACLAMAFPIIAIVTAMYYVERANAAGCPALIIALVVLGISCGHHAYSIAEHSAFREKCVEHGIYYKDGLDAGNSVVYRWKELPKAEKEALASDSRKIHKDGT